MRQNDRYKFHKPAQWPLLAGLNRNLKDHLAALQAEAATVLATRSFMAWPEDINAGGWLVHGVRFQDQDIIGQAPLLAALTCAPTARWATAITTAGYSAMLPGSSISAHVGYTDKVLRFHFPVIAAGDPGCFLGLRAPSGAEYKHSWMAGRGMVFDDTVEHWAENNTRQIRIVVLIDVLRSALLPAA